MTTPLENDPKVAKAKAAAAKAEAKALRPWFQKKRIIIPALIVVIAVFSSVSNSKDDNLPTASESSASENSEATTTPDASEEPSEPEEPAEPEIQTWSPGTYIVGEEIEPGQYRVAGYWARLDKDMEIIDNEAIWGNDGTLIVQIEKGDAYIEFSGEAMRLEDSGVIDPVELGLTEGTYLVGTDIAPGRYRISGDSAYFARLECNNEIIDNNLSEGSVIAVVKDTDCYLNFSGDITKLD